MWIASLPCFALTSIHVRARVKHARTHTNYLICYSSMSRDRRKRQTLTSPLMPPFYATHNSRLYLTAFGGVASLRLLRRSYALLRFASLRFNRSKNASPFRCASLCAHFHYLRLHVCTSVGVNKEPRDIIARGSRLRILN